MSRRVMTTPKHMWPLGRGCVHTLHVHGCVHVFPSIKVQGNGHTRRVSLTVKWLHPIVESSTRRDVSSHHVTPESSHHIESSLTTLYGHTRVVTPYRVFTHHYMATPESSHHIESSLTTLYGHTRVVTPYRVFTGHSIWSHQSRHTI